MLDNAAHKPSGSASATAITPMVNAVDQGLRTIRPKLATRL
ncbi:hypothetical protein [Lysobacter zhanggongensis]